MRVASLGIAHFHDLNEVATNAVRICKATHCDPRYVVWLLIVLRKVRTTFDNEMQDYQPHTCILEQEVCVHVNLS